MNRNPEAQRLTDARERGVAWRKWGPYLSERQWGTVREDYRGDGSAWEYFTGSGRMMTLFEVAREISRRLASIFLRGPDGRRPVFGATAKFQTDPEWRDHIPFYEYFHGDNGAGIGASHQTGWTGLVAKLLQLFGTITPQTVLSQGARGAGALPVPP
jgi:hypothetical protein